MAGNERLNNEESKKAKTRKRNYEETKHSETRSPSLRIRVLHRHRDAACFFRSRSAFKPFSENADLRRACGISERDRGRVLAPPHLARHEPRPQAAARQGDVAGADREKGGRLSA